jgi:uncharacterized protein YndB with AHSA1/START domain
MELKASVDISAPPARVWALMADVERWHEWTASITSIRRIEEGPFGMGSTARVKQPRFPAVTWRVTSFEPGVEFVWEAKAFGGRTIGGHRVEPLGEGSRVTLTVELTGGLTPVFGRLTAGITRRYIEMEAAGLKKRSEEAPPDSGRSVTPPREAGG